MKLRNKYRRLEGWCEGYLTFVIAATLAFTDEAMSFLFGDGLARSYAERGQVDSIITVVVVGVIAVVGLLVYTNVESSVTLDVQGARDDPANATRLENASADVGDGFGDAIELVPIVLIVLVAALVIGVISRFR